VENIATAGGPYTTGTLSECGYLLYTSDLQIPNRIFLYGLKLEAENPKFVSRLQFKEIMHLV